MNIYDAHQKAFANVSAFVILKDGERVATVAFKFPRDGAGRLYAYVHWIGIEMVRGSASGYGYDKRSAAVESAVKQMNDAPNLGLRPDFSPIDAFICAMHSDSGLYWNQRLEKAGFTVIQAV